MNDHVEAAITHTRCRVMKSDRSKWAVCRSDRGRAVGRFAKRVSPYVNVTRRRNRGSPEERAAYQAERKKLYEREHPETRHGAIGGGHPKQTAKQTGWCGRSVSSRAAHQAEP